MEHQNEKQQEQPAVAGSIHGAEAPPKFKTGEQLSQAYKELEAEFTRRSQRMQQLLRENQDLQQQLKEGTAAGQRPAQEAPPADAPREDPPGENPSADKAEEGSEPAAAEAAPEEAFSQTVRRFLDQYPLAAEFANDIARLIQADPALHTAHGLVQAYAQVLSGAYRTPAQMLGDERTLREVVLKDQRVRAGVLQEYLSSLEEGGAPLLMDSGGRGFLPVSPKNAPTSLEQAAALTRNLFKQKGV